MTEQLLGIINSIFAQYTVFIIAYFVALNSIYLLLIVFSFLHIRKQIKEKDVYKMHGLFASNLYNPISILAPAYNEEATVVESVNSLLQLRYPNFEVIVINDGSNDQTLQVLIDKFDLERIERYIPLVLDHKPIRGIYRSRRFSELIVVDKENGRKADALNAGINVCRNDLFCAIDADCVLEPDVLQNMLRCFIEDETTIAVGGIVRVANNCVIEGNEIKEIRMPKSFLARIQVVEYLRAFLFGRVGWDYMDSLLIISGAFGIFDRNAVLRVGGYLHDTVGEDMELVVRMHRYHRENKIPYRVRFLPEPVCWTEVPEDVNVLSRQRNRWHRGLADTIWRHRKMIGNPKYGRLGTFAMPFFLFFELLSPVIELLGYLAVILMVILGVFNSTFAILIFSATVLLGVVLSVASVLCEEYTFRRYTKVKDVLTMVAFAFIENFGYRQVHALWRFKGLVDFLRGNKEWGVMTRKGFGGSTAEEQDKTQPAQVAPVVSVVDGTPEYKIGQKIENFDLYSRRAEQIVGKYAGKQTDDGEYLEDDTFQDAYNRRSWTKTVLPVSVLLGSLLLMGIWINANTGQRLTLTQTDYHQVELSPTLSADISGVRLPLFAYGVLATGSDIHLVTELTSQSAPSYLADISAISDPRVQEGVGQSPPAASSIESSSHILYDGRSLEEVLSRIYQRPTVGHYFISEHLFTSNQRLDHLRSYRTKAATLGFRFFARPTLLSEYSYIAWSVGFGPFSTARQAIHYAMLHDYDIGSIQIINSAVQDLRVFSSQPEEAIYTIHLIHSGSASNQKLYINHLEELGFNNFKRGSSPHFGVYIGAFSSQQEAELIIEHTLSAYGITDAVVLPIKRQHE
ncbi:MAG: glycosyltransferase family 2 protein [Bacteroidetes bacterium]|nr:glycosyltransferase family 2 protein [Bacteroidota bacterium]